MATISQATPLAKKLYKTGRYKAYHQAMKAAMKQMGSGKKKISAVKILQKGENKKTPVHKVLMQKRSTTGTFKGYKKVSGIEIGNVVKDGTIDRIKMLLNNIQLCENSIQGSMVSLKMASSASEKRNIKKAIDNARKWIKENREEISLLKKRI